MTYRTFVLPDLGEGLTEAEILRWLVAIGGSVTVDQPIVEVETAKAAVEVPIPYAGVVTTLHGQPGDVLDVGSPLVTIAEHPPPQSNPVDTPSRDDEPGNVLVGYGIGAPARKRRRTRRSTAVVSGSDPAVASPVVRKLAHQRGIDLHNVAGSGEGGVITRRDLEAASACRTEQHPAVSSTGKPQVIHLRGLRRTAAETLSRSRREIPEATIWVDVDATELVGVRNVINAAETHNKTSLLALLSRFCVLGLQRFPELNAHFDTERTEILRYKQINLGFAAQTDRGLLVPVIRNAQTLNVRQLSSEVLRLTEGVRAHSLLPVDLTGGTFTVNNYGVFGVDGSAAIINHPEVAILGIGRIIDRVWASDGEAVIRKMAELTLAFDHRACDGGTAGGFLRFVANCIEHAERVLLEELEAKPDARSTD